MTQKNKSEHKDVCGANPECSWCALHKVSKVDDKKVVCQWGHGNTNATIMLIGGSLGKDELLQNDPFAGPSGQLLNKYLKLTGLDSNNIYITNCVKCKTETNKTPKPSEIKACLSYLDYEINSIKPKVIGLMGAIAFESVLGMDGITKFRGKPMWSEKYHCWCVPTWSPSYIIYNKETIEDTEQFRRDLGYIKQIAETGETGQLKTEYNVIDSIEMFKGMMLSLKASSIVSIDTETYGDFLTGKIITVQFSVKPGTAYVIPFYKPVLQPIFSKEDDSYIWSELKSYLEDSTYKKGGQNIKYDYQFFKLYGITLRGVVFDTMLAHYLLNENSKGTHDLGTMALNYTDMGDYSNELYQIIKIKGDEPDAIKFKMAEAPLDVLCRYACKDADATLRLICIFYPKIKQQGLEALLAKVMVPLSFALGDMEMNGVLVDLEYYKQLAIKYQNKINEIEHELAGFPDVQVLAHMQKKPVNFNSSDQMRVLFYDLLKLPVYKKVNNKKTKNKSIKPSTDKEVLEKLAKEHPIPGLIWKHRKYSKFLSTYVAPMPDYVGSDGRLHTSYQQHVTVTGRLSSSKPNLQNIPKKEPEMAKEIRYGIIATPGYTLVEADFAQIEFRLLANECKDAVMMADIKNKNMDIHKTIASIGFKIPYDKVSPELREKAKTIVYSIIYGKSEENLANDTGLSVTEVKAIFAAIFTRYKNIKPWMDSISKRAETVGEVSNWIGRRRRLSDGFKSGVEILMAEARRQAVNSPIQGGAHDIMSIATLRVRAEIAKQKLDMRLVMTIHDALITEIKTEILDQGIRLVKEKMEESYPKINVPLVIDAAIGQRLGDMTKLPKDYFDKKEGTQ